MYCGITRVPESYAVGNGSFDEFTWDSAFWVFNFVSNYCYLRYSDMIKDVRKVQAELEGRFLAEQDGIDRAAMALFKESPKRARDYLTEYSVSTGNSTVKRWKRVGEMLIFKYLDGNVKNELGEVTHPRYPDEWYRRIVKDRGDHFKVRE
jgi:dipeptidase